jgi:hypothetical protein
MIQPYQQRVIDEKKELDEKISKLKEFFKTDLYSNLTKKERVLLSTQCHFMSEYSIVLANRIRLFE